MRQAHHVAKIAHPALSAEEAFATAADAAAWQQMVEHTLAHLEHVKFDLARYAHGLAKSVRAHGAEVTRAAWLQLEVDPDVWARGYPVAVDVEAMFRDCLARRPQKPIAAYRSSGGASSSQV